MKPPDILFGSRPQPALIPALKKGLPELEKMASQARQRLLLAAKKISTGNVSAGQAAELVSDAQNESW